MVQTASDTTILTRFKPKSEAEKGNVWLMPFIDATDRSDIRELYGDVGALRFQFFPETITDTKPSEWQSRDIPGLSHPLYHWVSGGGRTISFTAIFARDNDPEEIGDDTLEAVVGGGADKELNYNIEAAIAWLRSFQLPTYTEDMEPLPPPKLLLAFAGMRIGLDGSTKGILCHVGNVDVTYQALFPSGWMRYAEVGLSFTEHIQRDMKVVPFDRRTLIEESQFHKKLPRLASILKRSV